MNKPKMNFQDALAAAKNGHKIAREGWNGKGQNVSAQFPDEHSMMTAPYLYLFNAQGGFVPWVPSQGDLFAEDWGVVE